LECRSLCSSTNIRWRIITGVTQPNSDYNSYIYLIKTNANGDTLWTRTYGNGNEIDAGYSVQQTNDGGYIVAGTIQDSATASAHLFIMKTNSNGDTLWTKSYGSNGNSYGYSVRQTNNNGFIIAGEIDSLGAGGYDALLIKTNSIGDTLWAKTYGGINDDGAESVELTMDGGYIITGYTNSFGAGGSDVYLIKTDSIGDTLWTKTYGGTGGDFGYSVKQTSDGGYIIAGSFNNGLYYYLIKTNPDGDTLWTKTYTDNSGFYPQSANSVQQTNDGGYIIAGASLFQFEGFAQIDLVKTNSTGDTLWTKFYNGGIYGPDNSVQQTTDGGYIIAGRYDMLLIKTDANGNSGCYQFTSLITINSFPTQVSSTATIVKSGCLVSNPSKPVGSGGTIVTSHCFSAGINEIKTNDYVSVYPNPTSGIFTLSIVETRLIAPLQLKFIIYDITGREVYSQPILNQESSTIDVSNLSNGIYFYQLTNHSETYRGKLVVEK